MNLIKERFDFGGASPFRVIKYLMIDIASHDIINLGKYITSSYNILFCDFVSRRILKIDKKGN